MDVMSLLTKARSKGLDVRAEGNKLVVRGPRSVEKLARQLLDRKAEVMPLLSQQSTTASDCEEAQRWAVRVWSDLLQESLWLVVDSKPPGAFPREHVRTLEPVAPNAMAWVPLTAGAMG
jgi:hypothetical protein